MLKRFDLTQPMNTFIIHSTTSADDRPIALHFESSAAMTANQFFDFCQLNKDLRIERSSKGEVTVMSPSGFKSGDRESEINMQLRIWAKQNGNGSVYSSSTGFTLPNGAVRSPDAAWVSYARSSKITAEQLQKFAPLCPEFVIELKSPSDRISELKAKMQEYIANGASMGLLIIAEKKLVYKYMPKKPVQELKNRKKISCEPVLPGFELVVEEIW